MATLIDLTGTEIHAKRIPRLVFPPGAHYFRNDRRGLDLARRFLRSHIVFFRTRG